MRLTVSAQSSSASTEQRRWEHTSDLWLTKSAKGVTTEKGFFAASIKWPWHSTGCHAGCIWSICICLWRICQGAEKRQFFTASIKLRRSGARKPYLPEASLVLPPYLSRRSGCICPDNGENGAIVSLYGVWDGISTLAFYIPSPIVGNFTQ